MNCRDHDPLLFGLSDSFTWRLTLGSTSKHCKAITCERFGMKQSSKYGLRLVPEAFWDPCSLPQRRACCYDSKFKSSIGDIGEQLCTKARRGYKDFC